MRLNKLTCGILLAMSAVPLYSSAATLSANDQTNTISGLDTSMMVSKDNGQHWATYSGEKDNNFPGTITVVVGTQDADAIKAVDYDPNAIYATGNTLVRYNGFYWTNAWYANPGEAPGSNEVWKKGAAISVKTLGTFSFHAFTGQAANDFQKQLKDKVAAQRKIIGYFPEWGVYDAHNNFTTDKIDFSQITHLNYGFTVVRNGVVNVFDSEQGPKLMPDLAKRTAAAGVTNMISVGGYTNSEEGVFEVATKDAAGVEKLSQSIVDYMVKWGFGGVDIDWEYPDTVAEKAQFTSLIQSLRGKLDNLGKQNDAYYQLSAAVVANYKKIEFMNPAVTTPLLDSVNLMAYDFHGAFDPITGHNAGLFANKADPQDQKFNTASVAEIYANTWSVPKSKIMVGIPYYGRGWGNVAATEKVKGLPGLFTAGSATVHGQWDDSGQFSGTNPYSLLKTWASNPDYTRYWDSEAKVPYLYNSKTKEFFTYDDKESVQAKVDYINQNGFGGAIVWDLSGDTADHELGKVVSSIKDYVPTPTPTPAPVAAPNEFLLQVEGYSTNKCIDVSGGKIKNGDGLISNSCTASIGQRFKFNEKQQITVGDKCVSNPYAFYINGTFVSEGHTPAVILDCNDSRTDQKWVWENGKVRNLVKGPSICMSVADDNKIQMKNCNDKDTSQKFRQNSFIESDLNDKSLGLQGGQMREGDKLEVYKHTGAQYQRLALVEDQSIKIGSLCLDVQGGHNSENANVTGYRCTGSSNQKWAWENGKIKSQMAGEKRCLSVNANNFVTINTCDDNSTKQKFTSKVY